MYGCLQPRELWFIDFNHVHVHVVLYSRVAVCSVEWTCTCKQIKASQGKWRHSRQTASFKEKAELP